VQQYVECHEIMIIAVLHLGCSCNSNIFRLVITRKKSNCLLLSSIIQNRFATSGSHSICLFAPLDLYLAVPQGLICVE